MEFGTHSPYQTIHLFMGDSLLHSKLFTYEKTWLDEFIRSFEKEAGLRNIRVVKNYGYSRSISDISGDDSLGFALWHSAENPIDNVVQLTATLSAIKPVVVFCLYLDKDRGQLIALGKNRPVFVSSVDLDRQCGLQMGRFLIGKGYKKAFYFTYLPDLRMSIDRCNGLNEAFETAGHHNAVVSLHSLSRIKEKAAPRVTKNDRLVFRTIDAERKVLSENLNKLKTVASKSHHLFERFDFLITELDNGLYMRKSFAQVFREAFSFGTGWAWACFDDWLALYAAMEFIRDENIGHPNKIGVLGCGDFPESSLHSLSSCHFDFVSAARRAISLILYPELRKRKNMDGINLIDLVVIDRGSA